MSLTGNIEGKTLNGKINKLSKITGYSAYEIAVINGFSGTEEDWLESLRGGMSTTAASLLIKVLRNGVYSSDQSENITALEQELGVTEVVPEATLVSISAVYSGGDVAVDTNPTMLTGLTVTAHYSDGTSETVTGYTLMGEIAEGTNTITVSYGGKTTTFTVVGFIDEEPVPPPGVTLSSISVTYSGGDVAVGTELSDLTGIVVIATYSDGSVETVTDYTLSGTIAEGSNTITVSYEGKTATFTVTGVAEETEAVYVYSLELGNAILVTGGVNAASKGTILLNSLTTRLSFLSPTGDADMWCRYASGSQEKVEVECYPIPVPADATGVNVSVSSSQPNISGFAYVDDVFTRTLDTGWQTTSSYSATFEPGTYQYMAVTTKRSNGVDYTDDNKPTSFVVEFTK